MTNREQKLLPSARQLTSVRRTSNLNSLTGLPERLDFLRQVQQLLTEKKLNGWCVLSIDIEHFKLFNNWYGQVQGDELLHTIGHQLAQLAKENDYIAGYFGGDDFFLCMPDDDKRAQAVYDLIFHCIEDYQQLDSFLPLLGICPVDEHSDDISVLCNNAQIASGAVRGKLNHRICRFSEQIMQQLEKHQRLLSDVRIGGDEFVILCCNRKHDEVLLAVEKLRMTLRGAEYEISVGVQQGTGQENVQNIVNRAEDAMRRDKEAYYQQNGQERRMRSLNEKLERLMQEKQDADQFIRVIAPEYIAVYLINFAQDSFRKILIPDFFRDMLDKCNGSFRRAMLEYIRLYIAPEDQEEFELLTCAQIVRERLAREGTIDEHYKRSDGMPIHLRIMACDGLNKEESIWIFAKDTEKN